MRNGADCVRKTQETKVDTTLRKIMLMDPAVPVETVEKVLIWARDKQIFSPSHGRPELVLSIVRMIEGARKAG